MVNNPLIRPAISWGFYVALGGSGPWGSHESGTKRGGDSPWCNREKQNKLPAMLELPWTLVLLCQPCKKWQVWTSEISVFPKNPKKPVLVHCWLLQRAIFKKAWQESTQKDLLLLRLCNQKGPSKKRMNVYMYIFCIIYLVFCMYTYKIC